jgi:serine/threonine protein phosphatase PrpC
MYHQRALLPSEKNEDYALIHRTGGVTYAVICDGHGGADVAKLVIKRIVPLLASGTAPADAFYQLEEEVKARNLTAGTTCSVLMIRKDTIEIAHVGDSRIVTGHHGQITTDHNPDTPSEYERITELGAQDEIQFYGVFRIGQYASTRSLGDLEGKAKYTALTWEPEIATFPRHPSDWYFLASDGVWDVLTPVQITEIIEAGYTAEQIAQLARDMGSADDISCILLKT